MAVDTIVFTELGGTGDGTEGSPDDLRDGIETGGTNSVVVFDGGAGAYEDIAGTGLLLADGQSLIGGGKTIKVTGVDSGYSTYFTAPGSRAAIIGTNAGESLIRFGDNATIGNLDLQGTGDAAILGAAYRGINNFTVMDNTVDGGFVDDMRIEVTNPGSSGVIMGNSVANASNDGIAVTINANDGGASDFDLTVDGNTATNAGNHGILVLTNVDSGSDLTGTVTVANNTTDTTGNDGIRVGSDASGAGSALIQTVTVQNNSVSNVTGSESDGIRVNNTADSGGQLLQTITIDDNLVDGGNTVDLTIGRHGINVVNTAANTGTLLRQTLTIGAYTDVGDSGNIVQFTDNHGIRVETAASDSAVVDQQYTINVGYNTVLGTGLGASSSGIFVTTSAVTGAAVTQTANVTGNSVTNSGFDGIRVESSAYGGGTSLAQTVVVASNVIAYTAADGDGIRVNTTAGDSATIDQESTIEIIDNTIRYTARDGIRVDNTAQTAGQLLQTITIDDNLIDGGNAVDLNIGRFGINVSSDAQGVDTLLRQTITIGQYQYSEFGDSGNIVQFTENHGIRVETTAGDEAVVAQQNTISIGYNTVTSAGLGAAGDGIFVTNSATSGATITQTANAWFNDVTDSGDQGISLFNTIDALLPSTRIDQTIDVSNNTLNNNAAYGLLLNNTIFHGDIPLSSEGTIVQSGNVDDNTIMGNMQSGIGMMNTVDGNGDLTQTITFDPNTIANNDAHGVNIINTARNSGHVTQDLQFDNNLIDDNGDINGNGITILSTLYESSTGNFDFGFVGNSVTGNLGGVDITAVAKDASTVARHNVVVGAGNNLSDGTDFNGLGVETVADGTATLWSDIEVGDSTFSGNVGYGILIRNEGLDLGGAAIPMLFSAVDIDGATVNNNGADGIRIGNVDGGILAAGTVEMATVNIANTTVTGNDRHGVELYNDGAEASQTVTFANGGNILDNNNQSSMSYVDLRIENAGGTQNVNVTGANTITSCTYSGTPNLTGTACDP